MTNPLLHLSLWHTVWGLHLLHLTLLEVYYIYWFVFGSQFICSLCWVAGREFQRFLCEYGSLKDPSKFEHGSSLLFSYSISFNINTEGSFEGFNIFQYSIFIQTINLKTNILLASRVLPNYGNQCWWVSCCISKSLYMFSIDYGKTCHHCPWHPMVANPKTALYHGKRSKKKKLQKKIEDIRTYIHICKNMRWKKTNGN